MNSPPTKSKQPKTRKSVPSGPRASKAPPSQTAGELIDEARRIFINFKKQISSLKPIARLESLRNEQENSCLKSAADRRFTATPAL